MALLCHLRVRVLIVSPSICWPRILRTQICDAPGAVLLVALPTVDQDVLDIIPLDGLWYLEHHGGVSLLVQGQLLF